MIKVKDGYAKLIGTTYTGTADRVLLSNGGDFGLHTGRNNEANKIVRTDASGYILAGLINTTSGDMGTTDINRIYCSNDGYIRYKTPANFFSTLANDSNLLSITVGSLNRKLIVAYAINSDTVDGLHASDFQRTWSGYAGKTYIGWIKIIEWTLTQANHFSPHPFILLVYREYFSPSPESYTLAFNFGWDSANIVLLNSNSSSRIIENFRVTKTADGLKYFVEMYVNTSYTTYQNPCYFAIGNYTSFTGSLVCDVLSETVTELCKITTSSNNIVAPGYVKLGSSDSYVLLGGGSHKALSDFMPSTINYALSDTVGGKALLAYKLYYSLTNYLTDLTSIDNFLEAYTFKCAIWLGTTNSMGSSFPGVTDGIILSGAWSHPAYGFQLAIEDAGDYFIALRWKQQKTWSAWNRIPMGDGTGATGTWNININGNADTVDGYHANNLVKFYLSPMSSGAPADSAKSWFVNTMPSGSGAIVYNVPGSEKTIIAGKSTGAYGHMLQLNYDDNYLRILRYADGNWKSTDWEKISAGYADISECANRLGKTWKGDINYSFGSGSSVKIISTSGSTSGNFASAYQSGLSVMSDYVGWQLTSYGGSKEHPYFRSIQDNGVWKPWKIIAFTSDIPTKISQLTNDSGFITGGPYLPLSGGTMNQGSHVVFPGTSTDASYGGSIEFREVDYVATNQTDWSYAPGITFHWGGRSVGKLGLRSDGDLAWRDLSIIHSGNISSQSVNYANSAGNAATATKLATSAGNATLPIYFSDGKPIACTASSIFSNLSNDGNNISITVAGQNRTLTVNYANSAGYTKRLYANSISDLTTYPGDYSLAYSRFQAGISNIFPTINNANGVITAHLHYGDYFALIGLSSDGRMYYRTMMDLTLDAGVTWNKVAWTTDIPTKVSQLTNDSGFITGGPYLPLTGGTLSGNLTVGLKDTNRIISIAGNTSHLKMVAHTNATYIESGNKDWNGNTPLLITGYSGNKGSNLYLYFDNIYCRSSGNSYVNLDSGNWSSYITIPTATSQLTNDSGFLTSRGYIGRTTVLATAAALSLTGIGNITPETASAYYLGASDKPWYLIFCRYFTSDLVSLSSGSNSGSLAYSSTSGYFYITANNIAANTSGGFVMKTVKNGVLSLIVLESASNYGQIKTTGDLYIGGRVSNTTALISSDAAHNMYISVQGKALLVCDSSENSIRRGKNLADNITLGTASCPWESLYVKNGVKLKGKTNYFSILAPNGTHSSDEIFSLPYTGGTLVTTNSPAMVKGWATYSFSYTNGTSSTYTMTFKAGGGVNIVGSPSYYEYYNGPGILIRIDNNCKDTLGTIKDSLMVWGLASDAKLSLYITKTTVLVSGSTVHYYLVYCTNTSGTALTSGSGTLNFIYF